ncbi:hypothetical protein Clacol_002640 [Clathrus columnatus]|uniref:CID domain-containing protein n=1 Tax=Clathrus columnatus TaxID=1419009 RepID=A0AAV5A6Q9_9AGAM|nr:hypothetical protein Clacol_002640 [Clathrus columnatus]
MDPFEGSINTKINILYMLDSLCEASLASGKQMNPSNNLYVNYVAKDLQKIIDLVVPDGRTGLLNLMSTTQVLESWRKKRIIDPSVVNEVLASLNDRKVRIHDLPIANEHFPIQEAQKRIEEDRERHKRLRERRWVQPAMNAFPLRLASFYPLTTPVSTSTGIDEEMSNNLGKENNNQSSIDVEFENAWETTSNWNEDDDEAVQEENALCFSESTSIANASLIGGNSNQHELMET